MLDTMATHAEVLENETLKIRLGHALTTSNHAFSDGEKNKKNVTMNTLLNKLSNQYVMGIWKIAGKVLQHRDPPDLFPHYIIPGLPYYVYHDSSFWTSGLFPGSA